MKKFPQSQDPEEQNTLNQIYGVLDGAIPGSAEELEEALLGDGKEKEWTEEQLENFKQFCSLLW
ncbi:MAG: hypothetical protein J2P36_25765 [Ktedonobacteraceae bacterium]|nr:hypothetical protein [Ktedonobacteraceae bacterium]